MTSGEDVDQPGFGFNPTEEDLINYYLPQKINGNHSVDRVIKDIDNICKYEPWELPGLAAIQSSKNKWYFFFPRNGERIKRLTKQGFWRDSGSKHINKNRTENQEIIKRYLTFYRGLLRNCVKTDWIMHEYYLKPSSSNGGYVICYLFQRSPKTIVNSVVDQGQLGHDSSSVIENPVVDQGEPGHHSFVIESPVADFLSPEKDLQFWDKILNSNGQDFTSPTEQEPRMQISQGPSFVNLQGAIGFIDESTKSPFQLGISNQHDNIQDEHYADPMLQFGSSDQHDNIQDEHYADPMFQSGSSDQHDNIQDEHYTDPMLQSGSSDQHDNIQDEHHHGSLNPSLDEAIPLESLGIPLIGYTSNTEAVNATVGHSLLEMHVVQGLSYEINQQINGIIDECDLVLPQSGTIGWQANISELQKSCPVVQDVHSYQQSTHASIAPGNFSPSESLGGHLLENSSDIRVFDDNSLFDSYIEAALGDSSLLEPGSACSFHS